MGLGNLFKLAKLTIEAYTKVERDANSKLNKGLDGSNKLEVQYNPESLTTKHSSSFQAKQGIALPGAQGRWSHSQSKELSVKLIFDGTNVGYMGVELLKHRPTVAEQVKTFLSLCYNVQSESHEPAFLTLKWGTGVLGPGGFECRLESVEIKYLAFERDGSPQRAELNAKFIEAVDPKKKNAQLRLSSPDLTHRRVVRSGDTLPLLCQEIYGSAEHYLRVAEVNGLDHFRELEPGAELFFPPFDRSERS